MKKEAWYLYPKSLCSCTYAPYSPSRHITVMVSFSCTLSSLSFGPCLREDSSEEQAAVESEEERQRRQNDEDDDLPILSEILPEVMASERPNAEGPYAPQAPVAQSQIKDDRSEEVTSS